MKSRIRFQEEAMRWLCALLLAAVVPTLSAADAEAPEKPAAEEKPAPDKKANDEKADSDEKEDEKPAALTPEEFFEGGKKSYNNWIEFSAGGFLRDGNRAQFQQQHRNGDEPFGGIEDFHYQRDLNKNTLLTADGRALFDLHDYRLRLGVVNEKVGYLRFSFDEFRVWSNGDGGYYPPTDSFFSFSEDALTLDRGRFTFEGGFTIEKKPKINFRYDHQFRDGEKSSTIWGITHPGGVTRGLGPSFYDIDERSDAFQVNVAHRIKKTDFGLGLRYEFGELANALKITQSPGEPVQRKITDQQDSGYDLFNAHAFSETWIKNNVLFSSGFSFTDLDNDFTGSRIYGSDFDVNYVPISSDGAGFFSLDGGSRLREYVMNLNLLTIPLKHFTIVPSLRVQKEDVDADFTGLGTLGDRSASPFTGNTDRDLLDVRERLDLRYAGVTNWVFHARGEWTQGQGNLSEIGGFGPVGGVGVAAVQRETEDDRFFQKYSAGARWYPAKRVTVDVGGYYKINDYGYDHSLDSTRNNTGGNRYPAFLVMQNFETYDAHVGLTLRPRQNVTVGSRYEFQLSTINTAPDSTSGLGETESSEMTSHIIAQNVSWSPWSRLHLQAGFNYVVSESETPSSEVTQAILDARNNYWTLTFNSSLVVDDKTDLKLAYFYYIADNYQDISSISVPYGAGAEQHGVTATIVRRIRENLRLKLKYGYFQYADETSGGYRDYDAHGLFSSLQYRF